MKCIMSTHLKWETCPEFCHMWYKFCLMPCKDHIDYQYKEIAFHLQDIQRSATFFSISIGKFWFVNEWCGCCLTQLFLLPQISSRSPLKDIKYTQTLLFQGMWIKVAPCRINLSLEKYIELKGEVGNSVTLPTSFLNSIYFSRGEKVTISPWPRGQLVWAQSFCE